MHGEGVKQARKFLTIKISIVVTYDEKGVGRDWKGL